jgi:hypothetical protein
VIEPPSGFKQMPGMKYTITDGLKERAQTSFLMSPLELTASDRGPNLIFQTMTPEHVARIILHE